MKQAPLRKIVRMLRREQPDTDPRVALFCCQRMNEAVRELQLKIARDLSLPDNLAFRSQADGYYSNGCPILNDTDEK
jgi:hypothetical protein